MFMLTRAATPRVLLFLLCLLLSGCASHIQKTLDRSILIEKRCHDIEQALPMRQEELKGALIDAVAIRLLGTCLDNSRHCLAPPPGEDATPTLTDAARQLAGSLQKKRAVLDNITTPAGDTAAAAMNDLKQKYEHLLNDLDAVNGATKDAVDELRKELQQAKQNLNRDELMYRGQTCNRRNDCIAAFAKEMAQHESKLYPHIKALQAQVARLPLLGQRAAALADSTDLQLKNVATATGNAMALATTETAELQQHARQVAESAKQLGTRLGNGVRTLESLLSNDVQSAAIDLMAARLFDKGADRLLGVIDRMLGNLDRVIGKIDDHTLGGGSLTVYLFSGDIQDQFDRLLTGMIKESRFSKTAQLAFASAACKRLGTEKDALPQTASMFSPFLYATLIRVEFEVTENSQITTVQQVRDAWEKKIDIPIEQADKQITAEPQSLLNEAAFQSAATAAYEQDAAVGSDGAASAPSMLQQVALCALVEQVMVLENGLMDRASKERSLAACASAVTNAVLTMQALTRTGSQVHAASLIASVPPTPAGPASGNHPDAQDAKAWRDAMQAVLAASAPNKPGPFDALCKQIASQVKGSRCSSGMAGSVILDFDASFALGQSHNHRLELQLAQLADILSSNQQNYRLVVDAYASRLRPACPAAASPAKRSACAAERNAALAKARAGWAFDVLKRRMGERFAFDSEQRSSVNPLSYDTPADRRVRVTLSQRQGASH